jgi:RNA polymerase sigma-70 factor, ECF subfamily
MQCPKMRKDDNANQPDSSASDSTSSSLIRQAQSLQPEAWSRLVEYYGRLIYHWCRGRDLGPEDAKDVSQEVFKTVASKIKEFRHDRAGDTFRGWLYAITKNKIGDQIRRCNSQPQAQGGTDAHDKLGQIADVNSSSTISSSEAISEEALLFRYTLERIRSDFEERTWEAFWRTAVEERSPATVADELGMTIQAVYKAKSRVLCRLRQELNDASA